MSRTKWLHVLFLLFLIAPYTSGQDSDYAAPRRDPYVYSANFNPSMLIIVVVLVSAFFFMGFFSIYIRQCSGDRSVSPGTGVSGLSRPGMKGLERAEIETFPTFVYSAVKELKIGKGTLECAVCLNEFEDDESLRLLPKCDHVFHSECIDAWLARHITCPVCRANLIPEESSSAESSDHHNNNQDNGISEPEGSGESTQFPIPVVEDQTCSFSSTTSMLGKFPRSNTTGHSIVLQPGGENNEKFTLRLPEEIRNKIVNGKLKRSSSCVSFPAGSEAGGTSRGKTNRFWRLDSKPNSDGWVFTMAPPFVSRTGSVRAAKMEQGEGSRSLKFLTSVKSFKSSIHCMSVKVDGNEQTALGRPPV